MAEKAGGLKLLIAAVTLLNLGLLVNPWNENFYYNAIHMIANATGAKDCWICTALPKGDMRLPLYGVGPTHWNCDNNAWPRFWRRHDGGYCDHDNSSYMTGPRFDLQILDNNTQLLDSVETRSDWKRNKIRHQIETGKYFSQTLGVKD